jgi:hypothetical protein
MADPHGRLLVGAELEHREAVRARRLAKRIEPPAMPEPTRFPPGASGVYPKPAPKTEPPPAAPAKAEKVVPIKRGRPPTKKPATSAISAFAESLRAKKNKPQKKAARR